MTDQKSNYTVPIVITLSEAKRPVFRESRGKSFVKFGDDNNYPGYLLELYERSSKHGAIVKGKRNYVCGNGWAIQGNQVDGVAQAFIDKCNRYGESLKQVTNKVGLDIEIFGGAYIQVIWTRLTGQVAEIYHLDYLRVRSNRDNTQFIYKEDWGRTNCEEKIYPAFNPSVRAGSQVLYIKEYSPGSRTYAMPGYMQSLDFIAADTEIGKHVHGSSKNGWSPTRAVTYTDGEPTEDEKKEIQRRHKKAFSGSNGESFILNFVNDKDKKPIYEDMGQSDISRENFSNIDTVIQSNIYTGHQITTPALFGIATPGSLGQQKELETAYSIFKNTFVNAKQQFLAQYFNSVVRLAGATANIYLLPVELLDMGLSEASALKVYPRQYFLDKAGIDLSRYDDPTPAVSMSKGGDAVQAAMSLVKMAMAAQAKKSSAEEDEEMLQLFSECGTPRSDCNIVKTSTLKFCGKHKASGIKWEAERLAFANDEISKLHASILDLISKDPLVTPEVLADVLKVKVKVIEEAIQELQDWGAIEVSETDGNIERTLTAPVEDLQDGLKPRTAKYEIRYSYDGPQDSKNRPFCALMLEMDKLYTRAEIESISERLGYSVWDRRGGFYRVPGTDETLPHCRHSWSANVVKMES